MAAAHKKLTVHSYPNNPAVNKAVVVGKFGGVDLEYAPGFEMGKTNKTPEFLKKNPNGQVPTLDTPEGAVFESTAIAYYVARSGTDHAGLLGATAYAQAQVDQWVHFARSRLEGLYPLFGFAQGYGAYSQEKFDEAKKKVEDAFKVLAVHFEHHPQHKYLLGDRITLADIAVVGSIIPALKVSLDEEFLVHHPKVKQYLTNYLSHDHVKAVYGETHYVHKFTPPAATH